MAKTLKVEDANGNPILTPDEARERFGGVEDAWSQGLLARDVAPPTKRTKGVVEPIPTDPAAFELRHLVRLVDACKRAWGKVPVEAQEENRHHFLAVFKRRAP